jgi:hypothetical protein
VNRSRLGPGQKALARGSTFAAPRTPLASVSPLRAEREGTVRSTLKRGDGFAASPAQRKKVRLVPCIRCGRDGVHPAHVIDRSLGGDDDPRAVVPLCPECHRLYDVGAISILEHLEPHYRVELAYAVELVGLITAIERITNERWAPEPKTTNEGTR